jgi:hypothetical protein
VRGRTEPAATSTPKETPVEAPELFEARPAKYKPTQFLIADDMKAALKERSYTSGRSMSELVREAVDEYLSK